MYEYDDEVLNYFLENQQQLFSRECSRYIGRGRELFRGLYGSRMRQPQRC